MGTIAQYASWISALVVRNTSLLGKCKVACEEMASAFPELTVVRGHVIDPLWGRRGHFWLTTPDGGIVDPTESQFPCPQMLVYEPWKPGESVRVGKCMECGEEIWVPMLSLEEAPLNKTFCDDGCYAAFARSVGGIKPVPGIPAYGGSKEERRLDRERVSPTPRIESDDE